MKGNHNVKVDDLCQVFGETMCCKSCALSGTKKYILDFVNFTKEYEDSVVKEEKEQLFYSRIDKLEWQLSKKKIDE